jgi:tRNA(Arg) A34 adenosine deaminase TadA
MIKLAGAFPLTLIEDLKKACEQAILSNEVPVSAICLDPRNNLSVVSFNEVEMLQSGMAHAECLALEAMQKLVGSYYLPDTILVTTLEPCTMCLGAMAQFRISGLVYFLSDEKAGYFSLHDISVSHRIPVRLKVGTHQLWVKHVPELGYHFEEYLAGFFKQLRDPNQNQKPFLSRTVVSKFTH